MKKVLLFALGALFSISAFSQTVLSENFDGTTLPDGWSMTSTNSVGWNVGTPASLSSTYWIIPSHDGNCAAANDDALGQNGNSLDDELMTPSMDFSTYPAVALTFDVFSNGSYGSLGSILVSTDGGDSFNEIYVIGYADGWQTLSIGLTGTAGESDVVVAFKHTDQGYYADGLAIDNVLIFVPTPNTASFTGITSHDYAPINSDYTLKGSVTNLGSNNITSMNVNWTTDDGQSGDALITGLNIAPFTSYEFTHPDVIAIGPTDYVMTEVTISAVNESEESIISDGTQSINILPLVYFPERKVLIEEATGTWCGWCPRGAVNLDLMADNYPNSIEVAVHNNDPMKNTVYDAGMGNLIGGYPSGLVDRAFVDINPSQFEELFLARIEVQALVSVGITTEYDANSRDLTATVTATFAGNANGNYRINAIVVEDNVTGTGSGYNQSNYYAGGDYGPMGGYENLPSTVPAADMVYRHVGRTILGGWSGSANSIPSQVVEGEEYAKTYTYNVPSGYDDSEITVVGLVINQETGEIMNAEESSSILSAKELEAYGFDFKLFPNPAQTTSNILLKLENAGHVSYAIYDVSGKQVASKDLGTVAPGEYLHEINIENLNSGMYFISITTGYNQITRKLSVN